MKTFFALLVFVILFAFFLPNLMSTPIGNQVLRYFIEKKTGIQIESETLSWSGPQIVRDLSFIKGTKRVTAKELRFQNKEIILQNMDIWIIGHHI